MKRSYSANQWKNWFSESVNPWSNESVNPWTHESMNQWTNERKDGWMDGWVGGWMDGWIGWVGGWMDWCTDVNVDMCSMSLECLGNWVYFGTLDQLATPLMEVLLQILQDIQGCLYFPFHAGGQRSHDIHGLQERVGFYYHSHSQVVIGLLDWWTWSNKRITSSLSGYVLS
mgnify:CR=1 FL=1